MPMKTKGPSISSEPPDEILGVSPPHDPSILEFLAEEVRKALRSNNADLVYAGLQQFFRQVNLSMGEKETIHGLYAEIEHTAPNLKRRIDRLRRQHTRILEEAKLISEDLHDLPAVAPLVDEFFRLVTRHESDEAKLFNEAYYFEPELPKTKFDK